jgi:hypothetical protein
MKEQEDSDGDELANDAELRIYAFTTARRQKHYYKTFTRPRD